MFITILIGFVLFTAHHYTIRAYRAVKHCFKRLTKRCLVPRKYKHMKHFIRHYDKLVRSYGAYFFMAIYLIQ